MKVLAVVQSWSRRYTTYCAHTFTIALPPLPVIRPCQSERNWNCGSNNYRNAVNKQKLLTSLIANQAKFYSPECILFALHKVLRVYSWKPTTYTVIVTSATYNIQFIESQINKKLTWHHHQLPLPRDPDWRELRAYHPCVHQGRLYDKHGRARCYREGAH